MSTGRSRTQSKQSPVVGVTGGIGSGKSEVCRRFAALGRAVIDADAIARRLTEENPAVRRAIQQKFGQAIYDGNGGLRRKELAAIVFAEPAKRKALNAIVHPNVFTAVNAAVESLSPSLRYPYVLVEAALVFESGMDKQLAATVLVRASPEISILRVMTRDGATREQVLERMKAQMSPEEKAKKADFVIDNDGPNEGLPAKVAFVDKMLNYLVALQQPAGK